MAAAKLDNRAICPLTNDQEGRGGKIQFPIFPIKGGRLTGEGAGNKKLQVFSSRGKFWLHPPFHLVPGPRAEELRQIGKSAFLCFVFNSGISLICLIISRLSGRARAWLYLPAARCSDSSPQSSSSVSSTPALPWLRGDDCS